MTAEQFDENWLRSRHFFVTGCNKGALVTLDDALAYAAHVREAAQREIMKDYAEDVEHFSDKLEASDRKLAESESGLNQLLFALGCQLGGVKSALQVIEAKNTYIETTESQLAKVEKFLQEAIGLDFVSSGDHSQRCVCWRCRAEKVLASL